MNHRGVVHILKEVMAVLERQHLRKILDQLAYLSYHRSHQKELALPCTIPTIRYELQKTKKEVKESALSL